MKTKQSIRNTHLRWLLLIGLVAIGILFAQQNVSAKSKSNQKVKTITITKVNQKTAKKVHKQLMRGKKFKIRVKGNTQTFHKKVEKLMDKVAKCTEYRFDFYPIILRGGSAGIQGYVKTKGGYAYCTIPPRDCQEYIYGIKFAKQRYKLFIDYIDKAIPTLEGIRDRAIENDQSLYIQLVDWSFPAGSIPRKTISKNNVPAELDRLIASMRELSQYLHKTKFYQLSEAMQARIMLTIGLNKLYEPAMRYTLDKDRSSFKALYKNKGYGWCSVFAATICKICAVFNIGDCDYFHSVAENHAVARVKVKTLSGKTKYSIISNGILDDYNDYVGYESMFKSYRRPHKMDKKLKKIKNTQELSIPFVRIETRTVSAETGSVKKMEFAYYVDIPRSEW